MDSREAGGKRQSYDFKVKIRVHDRARPALERSSERAHPWAAQRGKPFSHPLKAPKRKVEGPDQVKPPAQKRCR